MVFVFLWLTSFSMIISRSIQVAAHGIISFFFMVEQYSLIYVPHLLYPFIYSQTFRLFPYPCYCEYRCYKHRGTCIFQNYRYVQIYAQK